MVLWARATKPGSHEVFLHPSTFISFSPSPVYFTFIGFITTVINYLCDWPFSLSPLRPWALQGQGSHLSCLLLYPLTPESLGYGCYINIYGETLSWSGESWDLDLGMFDSQRSLKTQSWAGTRTSVSYTSPHR